MGLVDSALAAEAVFNADPDLFPGAQSLTYRKRTGATRTINGHGFEYGVTLEGGRYRHVMELVIPTDGTYGITAAEFDAGGDTVLVSYMGKTAAYMHLFRPTGRESQDA